VGLIGVVVGAQRLQSRIVLLPLSSEGGSVVFIVLVALGFATDVNHLVFLGFYWHFSHIVLNYLQTLQDKF